MRRLILAALLAASPAFAGDRVAKVGDDRIVLMDKPCPYASVLRHIKEEYRARFKKADTRIGGKRYFACYVVVDDLVMMVYEDGDQGIVPMSEFKDDPGV